MPKSRLFQRKGSRHPHFLLGFGPCMDIWFCVLTLGFCLLNLRHPELKLYKARKMVSHIPAGDGKSLTFFYRASSELNFACSERQGSKTLRNWRVGEEKIYPVLRKLCYLRSIVPNPRHFGSDPDPRKRTSDKQIRIRIQLFSLIAFKTPTKNNFFLQSF
jgi:hypothetical protein